MKLKDKSIAEIFAAIRRRISLTSLECFFASSWYNPFASVWLNFRCFPFSQAIKLPIAVYGRPKFFELGGHMEIRSAQGVGFGMIVYNKAGAASPGYAGSQTELCLRGKIIFRGKGFIGCGCKIIVETDAELDLGSQFKIMDSVNICCSRKISIGNVTRVTHRSQILDSNFHYIVNFAKGGTVAPLLKTISIGNNCWICNSSTVTGGAVIPNLTIVASHSLVNKDFSDIPPQSLIAGQPAKYITSGLRRIDDEEWISRCGAHFKKFPDTPFVIPSEVSPESLSFSI